MKDNHLNNKREYRNFFIVVRLLKFYLKIKEMYSERLKKINQKLEKEYNLML